MEITYDKEEDNMMNFETAIELVAAELEPAMVKAWLADHEKEWTAALTRDIVLLRVIAANYGIPIEQLGTGYSVGYWRGRTENGGLQYDTNTNAN